MNVEQRTKMVANKQLHLSCIVPIYNEETLAVRFITKLGKALSKITNNYEIIIVNDGSSDKTEAKLLPLLNDTKIKLLSLSRNFGKENAITCGLENCHGDAAIIIDADFQHPFEIMPIFVDEWSKGFDMVYGVRKNRESESFIKRGLTRLFYHLTAKITRIKIPANAGDFRLLDRKVIDAINSLDERNRFMKGLYAWVGFSSKAVPFTVNERAGGKSSWKLNRLTELAVTGITSFSNIPLQVWSFIGFTISAIALTYALYIVTETLLFGIKVPGYATIVVAIMLFGGIQLFSIGVLGEYIARIFNEVKQRPKYIINNKHNFND